MGLRSSESRRALQSGATSGLLAQGRSGGEECISPPDNSPDNVAYQGALRL